MAKPADKPDYYSILGVSKEASRDQVRTSYKLLAMRMHPDKNRDDPTATQKFQRLVEAYSVLTDPIKREQYDQFGTVQDDYDNDEEACECGQHHNHHNYEEFVAFRSFFTEMFNRHYKNHGFDGFVDDSDSDEEEETFVTNLWGSYGSRSRFAADWDSVPRAMFTEKQLKYQGTAPDKPGRPKATFSNNKIKVEWAKKNSAKEVLFHVLAMKTPSVDWTDIYTGDAKSFEVTPEVAGTHSFRVSAGNRAGRSQFSEIVTVSVSGSFKSTTTAPAATEKVATKSTTNGSQKKPETKVETATKTETKSTSQKKKNKNAADPKLAKLLSDLQFAVEAADVNEIKKLLATASSVRPSTELAETIKKANELVEAKYVSELHSSLVEFIETKNMVELEAKLKELQSLPNFEKHKKTIERDMNRASQILTKAQEEQQTREKVVQNLQEAMDLRDLNRLLVAIENAKKLNVPVRDAKKFLRKLEKGDVVREQLIVAAKNGDKLSLQELIRQAKEKNLPFDKELKVAQEKLESILNEEESLLRELYGFR